MRVFGRFRHDFTQEIIQKDLCTFLWRDIPHIAGVVLIDEIEVGLDTERKFCAVGLRHPLGLEPALIPLTAEVLHGKKVRFPCTIVDMGGYTRLELTEGIKERAIVPLWRDRRVGDLELALGKRRDE